MLQKYQIKGIVVAAVVFFLVSLFVRGGETESAFVDSVGFAVTATCVLVLAYRKIIWRIDPFLDVPDFGKIDKVVLEFTHVTTPNLGTDVPAKEGRNGAVSKLALQFGPPRSERSWRAFLFPDPPDGFPVGAAIT